MAEYRFDENNSGGKWWLDRSQYDALFRAGWKLDEERAADYEKNGLNGLLDEDEVPWSWRHNLTFEADSIEEAVQSWESATNENFFAGGCPCCGAPFSISSQNYAESLSGGYEERARPF